MKNKNLIQTTLMIFCCFHSIFAQNWQYVGKQEDGQALLFKGKQINQSLKISPQGIPFVAFRDEANGNKLSVLSFDGSNWDAVGNVGISDGEVSYISLAFSPTGIPHVAFSDYANFGGTTVLKFNGNNWQVVGAKAFSAGIARFNSLAFNKTGIPCVAYSDALHGDKTSVLYFTGFNWIPLGKQYITPNPAIYQSLAFTPEGDPIVAFSEGDMGVINKTTVMSISGFDFSPHIPEPGREWTKIANGLTPIADYIYLVVSPSGIPHIAYRDYSKQGKTSVLSFNGVNWGALGELGISDDVAGFQSLAISSSGTVYVAYYDEGNLGKTTVLSFNGSNWGAVGQVGISKGWSEHQSLAISSSGIPFVAYSDYYTGNKTTVLSFDGSNWNTLGAGVISNSSLGIHYPSLGFDALGIPFIAFQNQDKDNKTSVISFDGINWGYVGDTTISNGRADEQSLAIAPNGTVMVAYSDFTNGSKTTVLSFGGTNWEPVGNAGFGEGAYNQSLAISRNGIPYLAYQDNGNGGFQKTSVFKFENGNWDAIGQRISIGSSDFQSLALSPSGLPYVAYQDYSEGLKTFVLSFNGSNWGAVGSTTGISEGQSYDQMLAFSPSGTPWVVYQDSHNNSRTMVLSFNGSNWNQVGNVNQNGKPQEYQKIAFNNQGVPFVSYSDDFNFHKITVTSFDGSNWNIIGSEGITAGSVFEYSLKINPITGEPWIAYSGAGGGLFVQKFGYFNSNKLNQTISIDEISNITLSGLYHVITVNGQASSGLPIQYSIIETGTQKIAYNSNNGNLITVTGAGTVIITAYQPGNDSYNDAVKTFSFEVIALPNSTYTEKDINQMLFPNPNQGLFCFQSFKNDTFTILTFDGTEKLKGNLYIGINRINTELPKGMYIFQNGIKNQKLIIE